MNLCVSPDLLPRNDAITLQCNLLNTQWRGIPPGCCGFTVQFWTIPSGNFGGRRILACRQPQHSVWVTSGDEKHWCYRKTSPRQNSIDINVKEGTASRKKGIREKSLDVSRVRLLFTSLCPGKDWHFTDFRPSGLKSQELLSGEQNLLLCFSNASLMTAKRFVGGHEKCPSSLTLPSTAWYSMCSPCLSAARWCYLWSHKEWVCHKLSHSTFLADPLQPGDIWKLPTELTKQAI